MRIQKYLRDLGVGSRRKVESLIEEGRILVNGKPATLGQDVSSSDTFMVDGKMVSSIKKKRCEYLLLNKPSGYVCSKNDGFKDQTIYELLPAKYKGLNIAGRLDKNSQGLIIRTDDGDLLYKITHPKFGIEKEYQVEVNGNMRIKEAKQLERGVLYEGEKYRAKQVRLMGDSALRIVLVEGKKREIRYMCKALGYEVLSLKRIRIGSIKLGSLSEGKFKKISKSDFNLG